MKWAWIFVVLGGLGEMSWVVALKYSEDFTIIPWVLVAVFFIVLSLVLLSMAIDRGVPLGTAYATWVGVGSVSTFFFGILFLGDPVEALRFLFVGMIIAGVVGLQRTAPEATG